MGRTLRDVATELARRYRAARAYAGLDQDDLAERLGLHESTVKRREAGKDDPKPAERIAVASICGLPESFFDLSTGPQPYSDELAERLGRIELALNGFTNEREALSDLAEGVDPGGGDDEDDEQSSQDNDDQDQGESGEPPSP